jgi:NAD(P)-dependent dehydrogenase (short-subunit alcohol dehydrogenase family)
MSNIIITGHTCGLGKELACIYPDYTGFSRSNGYDINNHGIRTKIVQASANADIIFNNAHAGFSQIELLYLLFDAYKHTNKTIVNISSISPETSIHRPHKYAVEKLALDAASKQLDINSDCRIVLVKPGLFISNRSKNIPGTKMPARYIAQEIKVALLQSDSNIINIQ